MRYKKEVAPLEGRQSFEGLTENKHYNHFSMSHHRSVNTGTGKILVPSDDGDKTIGLIKSRVFFKSNWHSSKHLCFKHNAIGVDKRAWEEYILPYAERIECYDRDKDITYTVSVSDFEVYAIEDDLGWGAQLFCPLKFWQIKGNGHHKQLSFSSLCGGNNNG